MTDVENMSFLHMRDVENVRFLHMMDVGKFHHLLIHQINNVYNLWCFNAYYAVLLQSRFAIYAVLSQNPICRDLRTFAWRKIEPKIVSVEKNDKYEVCNFTQNRLKNLGPHCMRAQ